MSSKLKNRKIILGVCGGIAAYKSCELVRQFKKDWAEVRVIMTPSALNFVSPVTLSTLSGNEVIINLFPDVNTSSEKIKNETWHIHSGLWADLIVIAPATANTISKIVNGQADNFLTATVLSARCPLIICPAMDEEMYLNETTQRNISLLKELGCFVIDPEKGELASGLTGIGRLPEPETIAEHVRTFLKGNHLDLKNKKILITAGPTYEPIDAVRFIGNYSSGKMGFALAKAAVNRRAEVTLVSGPSSLVTPRNVKRIDVKTSDEMFNAVKQNLSKKDAVIMSAAVADFKPKDFFDKKLKKSSDDLTIETEKTIDILEYLGKHKKKFKLVGFALETENEIKHAKEKLKKKNLNMIVVNNPKVKGAGFNTDTNIVTIITKNLKQVKTKLISKYDLANLIYDNLLKK